MRTKLEKAIIKAVPSILDLKFGCRLLDLKHQFFGNPDPINCVICDDWSSDEEDRCIEHYRGRYKETVKNIKDETKYKIIGRDITLADILIVLGKKYYGNKYNIDLHGAIVKNGSDRVIAVWDLTKTLKDQLKEIKDFLSDLLT